MQKPDRKVTLTTVSGAITTVVVWLAHEIGGVEVPAGVESALVVVVMAGIMHLTTPKKED